MKRIFLSLLVAIVSTNIANAQISLAVMDFKQGSNMTSSVDGLSDMLINSLFESGNYDIIERNQISSALKELNIQGQDLSLSQLIQLGVYLKVDNVLVGTVNFIATGNSSDPGFLKGEYNIDVRIVSVKSSRVIATAGVVKDGEQTYRSLMPSLAAQLSKKINASRVPCIEGYLHIYPEQLSKCDFKSAIEKIEHLNSIGAFGRKNWRLPSVSEAKMILENLSILTYPIKEIWTSGVYHYENISCSLLSNGIEEQSYDEDYGQPDLLVIPVATD